MNRNVTRTIFLLMIGIIGGTGSAAAQITGQEIMEKVYTRPQGDDMSAELTMTITNSRGSTRERSIVQYRSREEGVEKKIMFFTSPADVRDTSFLSWSYDGDRADDQWIYLPALRRVKRISAGDKNASFMGSDFTYDDMGERHPDEDSHTLLREETLEGEQCYVVESTALDSSEGYSKAISWIIKDEWIGLKKEFYDTSGTLYKKLTIDSYDTVKGYWVISDMTMKNLEKGTSTRIEMNGVEFDSNLDSNIFTERQMKMGPPR